MTVRLGVPYPPAILSSTAGCDCQRLQSIRRAVEELEHNSPLAVHTTAEPHAMSALNGRAPSQSEIEQLPAESCLVESGAFQVFLAEASEIPTALREIGRLREITYRAIGEGTGRHLDLDAFDVGMCTCSRGIASGNRLSAPTASGRRDRIMAAEGVHGLYTRTLFRYDERLIARLSPALELGRSFVRAEYQKNYNALLLLWKGIGRFVARHPQYRVLFGPVSISCRYSDSSHRLLMAFLQQNHLDQRSRRSGGRHQPATW